MSVLQKIRGLTKKLYFLGGSPVSMQNVLLTRFTCFDISIACIIRTDNHHFSKLKG